MVGTARRKIGPRLINQQTPAWAVRLLKELCTYVLAGGVLEDGDIMQMRHDLPQIVGVVASPESDGAGLLRVVLLA